ncbi:DUF4145 domain-containing protein [Virgibacillus flavescens]|uniref:DUF4145 domain-containing protein n=1 Tax=Virgibacillus flavescens TaxID=1611422 RepID=UPI003D336506
MAEKRYSDEAILCLHCGNETILEIKSEIEEKEHEFDFDGYGRKFPILTYFSTYTLYKCPVCFKVSLTSLEYSDIEIGPDGSPYEYRETLYPVHTGELSLVPAKIRNAYESSLKTKNVDNVMCVMGLRRTLDILCRVHGEVKGSLNNRLNKLSEKGIIPGVLDDASHLIRVIGNSAAHDDVDFDSHVVNNMIKFTRIILEYVYVIPKEIERMQIKFESKK